MHENFVWIKDSGCLPSLGRGLRLTSYKHKNTYSLLNVCKQHRKHTEEWTICFGEAGNMTVELSNKTWWTFFAADLKISPEGWA